MELIVFKLKVNKPSLIDVIIYSLQKISNSKLVVSLVTLIQFG